MCGGLKGNDRLIQTLPLPVCLFLAPVARVAGKTIDELMVSPVLGGLVAVKPSVAIPQAGRVDQSQAQRIVVRLVRTIFAIGKNGDAEIPALIGEVKPLMRRNFEFLRIVIAALDGPYVPVIGRLRIGCRQRKCSFQRRSRSLPS